MTTSPQGILRAREEKRGPGKEDRRGETGGITELNEAEQRRSFKAHRAKT